MTSQACSFVKLSDKESSILNEREPISLDDVALYERKVCSFKGTWISDKEIIHQEGDSVLKFDVPTKTSRLIAKEPIFKDNEVYLSADENYLLLKGPEKKIHSYVPVSKYSVYDVKTKTIKDLANGQLLPEAVWAPKGSALVYVLNNDVYYHKLDSESDETCRLTSDGKIEEIFNGITDWIYGEEVFQDRCSVLWFSPNGDHLVFPKFDDSHVDDMVISRYNTPGTLTDQYPQVVKYKYAKAGTPIPKVSLNLVDLTKKETSLINLQAPTTLGSEPILWCVDWSDDKTIVATWTNRVQNSYQIVTYSLDGKFQLLLGEDVPNGWLLVDLLCYPPKMSGGYFFHVELEPVGDESLGSFKHLIGYRMSNGKLEDGRFDFSPGLTWVSHIVSVDDAKGIIYYIASPAGRPSQKQLYQVNFRASEKEAKCISQQLNTPEGNACAYVSGVSFSKGLSYYALTCAGPDPAFIGIYSSETHVQLYEWFANADLRQMLSKRLLPKAMDLEVPVLGGKAQVRLLLPVNFDPSNKYPMIVRVYAGPNSQSISDAFAIGFEQYMTTKRQVICAYIDGRGSSSKGTTMMYALYRNLGHAEIEDQINVTWNLQQSFPWIDKERTGIWGRSYGGYVTATILTKDRNNVFKCGIATCPVTSWFYYDAIWTERYMGLPRAEDNLSRYESSQVMSNVENLRKKMLMVVHGSGDDNVHLQQSMALSKALVQAGILFEQFFYTDEYHPLKGVYKHLFATFDKYFSRCLGYDFD